jgi:hypothetical protein
MSKFIVRRRREIIGKLDARFCGLECELCGLVATIGIDFAQRIDRVFEMN